MLLCETLGKSTSNCSQWPLAGGAEKWWVRHQQGWMPRWGRSHLPFGGFFRKEVEPAGMLPDDKLAVKREKLQKTSFFLGSLSRDRHIFLRFKLALSCGFLNWAAGSRLLPHRPMFCTSFDFEKNKGLFLLALITVVLNFQFFPKS